VRAGNTTQEKEAGIPKARLDYNYARVLGVVLPGVYAAALCLFCLAYGVLPGPEFIVLCFFIYAAYNKTSRRFIGDWAPFLVTFLSFEAMYGVVGSLPRFVHFQQPANVELQLFGSIPTLVLQQLFRSPFLDYVGAFFYSLHFIAPTVFAFVLWKYCPRNYRKYTLALALGTYGALVTFLVYPAAPPWAGVDATRILFQVDNRLGIPFYRTLMDFIGSNPYAAFPSIHAMYPWVISLYALKIKKAKALPILVFPLGVWFSAVYLGEHYVIDVIGGIVYATCAFLVVEKLVPFIVQKRSQAKVSTEKGSAANASSADVSTVQQ
jgi:membrane-associated phospholipid phosphatase